MKEILSIKHGMLDDQKDDVLRDYGLTVCEGDIFYIQGLEGSGVRTLISLLAGECPLKQGSFYLWEKEVKNYDRNAAYQYGIYTITAEKDLVEELTVAENLEAVRYLPFAGKYYSRKKAEEQVAEYLKKEQVNFPSNVCLWTLGKKDRQKLSILKAKMHGARLIVLDTTRETYEGQEAEELCALVRRANREGITFIILSECYNMFAEIASRIQIIDDGRDLKEWLGITDRVRRRLIHQTIVSTEVSREKQSGEESLFIGFFDYEWEMKGCIWDYLSYVKEQNPEIWEQYVGTDIPEAGVSQRGNTVVIPRDSAEHLLKNLSIADNLIMTIPLRVSGNRFRMIRKRVRENIAAEFYRRMHLGREIQSPGELSRIQKKILSVYRFELSHPHMMILESPYGGLNAEERSFLRKYLRSVAEKGVRILYFSKSMEEIREDCRSVIITRNGRRAEITTF